MDPRARRALYLIVAAGFLGQAIASWAGVAPRWPNPRVWAIVAGLAAFTTATYAVVHQRRWLRLSTAAVILASFGRSLGWMIAGTRSGAQMLAASSVWAIVGGLACLVYIKAGMVNRS